MKTLILSLIIAFLPGCSVLKNRSVNKSDSSFVQREKLASSVSLQERTDNEIRLIYADSGKHSFVVEISPEGAFTYSPVSGYNGKAKMLKISGHGEAWKQGIAAASTRKEIKIDSASSKSIKSEVAVSTSQTSVKAEKPRKWYVWTLIVAGALMGWLIIRKRLRA